ncbi:ADP-ribosylation, partial [Zopfia rhizophila CBS 207.26]
LASLVSGVTAASPATLYRGDSRGPNTIKDAGGFKAKGFDNPEGTLFEHVEGRLKHPSRDPFISTSSDIDVSKGHAGNGYLYTLDSSKIDEKIWDVAEEYEKAGKKYGHSEEKEFAVEHLIPWDAVTKIQKKKDGEWKTI